MKRLIAALLILLFAYGTASALKLDSKTMISFWGRGEAQTIYATDQDGAYLTDEDGAYITVR